MYVIPVMVKLSKVAQALPLHSTEVSEWSKRGTGGSNSALNEMGPRGVAPITSGWKSKEALALSCSASVTVALPLSMSVAGPDTGTKGLPFTSWPEPSNSWRRTPTDTLGSSGPMPAASAKTRTRVLAPSAPICTPLYVMGAEDRGRG